VRDRKGQSLIEFAIVVPVLLILLVGIMEFSRAWMTMNVLTGAAREAARRYAVSPDTAAADARADSVLAAAGLDLGARTLSRTNFGNTVSYTILYDFPVSIVGFVPGLSTSTIPLSSTTTMRKEY
jgi:Flp pilus assembly protein TadG